VVERAPAPPHTLRAYFVETISAGFDEPITCATVSTDEGRMEEHSPRDLAILGDLLGGGHMAH
jgi:hypothetical protein